MSLINNSGDKHDPDRRQWRVSVNSAFAQRVGPRGVRAYVDVLAELDRTAPGRDLDDVLEELTQKLSRHGVRIDDVSARRLAEQLRDPERAELVIATDDGEVLYGQDWAGAGGSKSAQQLEPEDNRRPTWT